MIPAQNQRKLHLQPVTLGPKRPPHRTHLESPALLTLETRFWNGSVVQGRLQRRAILFARPLEPCIFSKIMPCLPKLVPGASSWRRWSTPGSTTSSWPEVTSNGWELGNILSSRSFMTFGNSRQTDGIPSLILLPFQISISSQMTSRFERRPHRLLPVPSPLRGGR